MKILLLQRVLEDYAQHNVMERDELDEINRMLETIDERKQSLSYDDIAQLDVRLFEPTEYGNITAQLGAILIDAADQHIAPNAVADLAYDVLIDHGESLASQLSLCMYSLAEFVDPE